MWPIPLFRVAIIVKFCFVCLFLIIFLLKQFVNDFLDSFVLFMFQGVLVNPFRYNYNIFISRIIVIYSLEQFINLPHRLSAEWSCCNSLRHPWPDQLLKLISYYVSYLQIVVYLKHLKTVFLLWSWALYLRQRKEFTVLGV